MVQTGKSSDSGISTLFINMVIKSRKSPEELNVVVQGEGGGWGCGGGAADLH